MIATALIDCGDLCGESPRWDAETQTLYWTDASGKKLHMYSWQSGRHEVILDGFEVNGFAVDAGGGLVLASCSGIWIWRQGGMPIQLASHFGNIEMRVNDCTADPQGRLIVGSNFYSPNGEYQLGKLLLVDLDGSVRMLDEGFHLANGMAFSPNAEILYFADSIVRRIYCYAYDAAAGQASTRKVFAILEGDAGLPDGLAVDAEGFVWCAEWYGSRITRFDPDGKVERRISLPAKQISSLTFGGPELTDIFVTSAATSEPMPAMPPGYDPQTGYFGGALFHINVGIAGKQEFKTALNAGMER
jgi:D-xylonolactonase